METLNFYYTFGGIALDVDADYKETKDGPVVYEIRVANFDPSGVYVKVDKVRDQNDRSTMKYDAILRDSDFDERLGNLTVTLSLKQRFISLYSLLKQEAENILLHPAT